MDILIIIAFISLIFVLYDANKIIKTQRDNLYKSSLYINRLKAVAKMNGCDLSNVKDDRKDLS